MDETERDADRRTTTHRWAARRATAVAEAFSICGVPHPTICHARLLGQHAWLAIEVDAEEVHRRAARRVSPITDRRLLQVLCNLPAHYPVAIDTLSPAEQTILTQAPSGLVHITKRAVTRRAVPAVTVHAAAVVDGQLDRGLNRASNFASFCPRLLLLTNPTAPSELELADADFYGIGLLHTRPHGEWHIVVHSEPTFPTFGPVTWRLREQALAAATRSR